jgi:hypothetical protein
MHSNMQKVVEKDDEPKLMEIAKELVAIEKPLPETADLKAVVELLGRIEHELIVYRRERLFRTYLIILLFLLPILGLGYIIPEFMKGVTFR